MVSLLQIYEENDKNETIWLNLEFIGAIYDGDNMKERQLLETLSLHRSVSTGKDKYEKSLNKELLGHVVTISKQEFNLEIQKRLIKLKNLALDHVHHLFDWFIHKEKPIEFMENKLTLFKIFLLNTENSQIMARVCKTLELIKSNYPAIIKSQHLFENQIAFSKKITKLYFFNCFKYLKRNQILMYPKKPNFLFYKLKMHIVMCLKLHPLYSRQKIY